MKNVEMKVKGKKLILEMDLEQRHGPSKSRKTTIVASSEGNQLIDFTSKDEEMFLGLNLYTKRKKK